MLHTTSQNSTEYKLAEPQSPIGMAAFPNPPYKCDNEGYEHRDITIATEKRRRSYSVNTECLDHEARHSFNSLKRYMQQCSSDDENHLTDYIIGPRNVYQLVLVVPSRIWSGDPGNSTMPWSQHVG